MLFFGKHRWILVNGTSRFDAYISTGDRKSRDVTWFLRLRYYAGGARWRRVLDYRRPSVWLELSSFEGPSDSWTNLAHKSFWADDNLGEDRLIGRNGAFDVTYFPHCDGEEKETFSLAFGWRIGAREGRLFTVEIAAVADANVAATPPPAAITADGVEEEPGADSEFWKEHADLYVIEQIPFGTVSVRVPRNVRDPEAFALGRARSLIGVGEPEHIEVTDHAAHKIPAARKKSNDHLISDLWVNLHFNGHYEG